MGTPEAIARTADLGGASRDRTDDLYNAIVALSQLSYGPERARKGSGWRRLRQSESVVFCDDMPTLKCGHACSNRVTTALTGRRTVASEVLDSGLTSSAVESRRNDEQKKNKLEPSISFRSMCIAQAGRAPSWRIGGGGRTGASCCRRVAATARLNGSPRAGAHGYGRRSRDRR